MPDVSRSHDNSKTKSNWLDTCEHWYSELSTQLQCSTITSHPSKVASKTVDHSAGKSQSVASAPIERTTVHFKEGDTLWDLAESKYRGQYSLGAVYEANGLTPRVVTHNGKREFLAPTCYAGCDYILPAQSEMSALDQQFKLRIGLAVKSPESTLVAPNVVRTVPQDAGQIKDQTSGVSHNPVQHHPIDTSCGADQFVSSLKSGMQSALHGIHGLALREVRLTGLVGQTLATGISNFGSFLKLDLSALPTSTQEIPPPDHMQILPGSYYRKTASSFDPDWSGVTTIVTLGTPKLDRNRQDPKSHKPLDGFSIYVGGNAAGQEIDAGLTWEATKDTSGHVSQTKRAWRPFWLNNKWDNAPAKEEYYWHPGDTVALSVVKGAKPGWLTLSISDIGPSPKRSFHTEIEAKNFCPGIPVQFKTVTAIDQKAGQAVSPTDSCLIGTSWQKTLLIRGTGTNSQEIPLTLTRRAEVISHKDKITCLPMSNLQSASGETIHIRGLARKI